MLVTSRYAGLQGKKDQAEGRVQTERRLNAKRHWNLLREITLSLVGRTPGRNPRFHHSDCGQAVPPWGAGGTRKRRQGCQLVKLHLQGRENASTMGSPGLYPYLLDRKMG